MSAARTNLGVVKYQISALLGECLVENRVSQGEKQRFKLYVETVRTSPVLATAYFVYDNLEHKTIKDTESALRYLEENLSPMRKFTHQDWKNAHKLLEKFQSNTPVPSHKEDLYTAVHTFLEESLKPNNVLGIDRLHESVEFLLDYIAKPKPSREATKTTISEEKQKLYKYFTPKKVNDTMLEAFRQQYSSLSESEIKLVATMVSGSQEDKLRILEELKQENKALIESKLGHDQHTLKEVMQKLDGMLYTESNLPTYITELIELRKGLQG